MTLLHETSSATLIRAESKYFRALLKDKQIATPKSEWASEKTLAASSVAYDLYDIEIAKKNFEISYKELRAHFSKLQSSKAYSLERTSPIVNVLSKIWVNWKIGLTWRGIDIDRIHRTFMIDITSSDPVEDFVQVESRKEIKKIDYGPRTLLGQRLLAIRARIVDSGKQLFDWEQIEREISSRRGGAE